MQTQNKLWTKDFTIITLGSVVSMLGNAMSGFAISLLVLDYTGSTFMYVLFMVTYNLPKVLMPIVVGPLLDRFSRKRMIYTLDFISAGLYGSLALLLNAGFFNYGFLLFFSVIIGSIDSTYTVAYESLYPNLVSEGNLARANSITSIIMPLAQVMSFLAAVLYNTVGIVPLFLINAASFLVAAIFETQIGAKEKYLDAKTEASGLKRYTQDFKEGLRYIASEKGLLFITVYFGITMFADGSLQALFLPFFREFNHTFNFPLESWIFENGEYTYMIIMGCGVLGRVLGGTFLYRHRYPVDKKFLIATVVYLSLSVLYCGILFMPIAIMMLMQFITGMMGVTSYNIRITGTQAYVPDEKRARFNGSFVMINTLGMMLGQLVAGALAEIIPIRTVIVFFYAINLIAAIFIIAKNKKDIAPIYNIES